MQTLLNKIEVKHIDKKNLLMLKQIILKNEKESMLRPVDTESLKSGDPKRITKIVPRAEMKSNHEMIEENYRKYFI